MNVDVIIPTYNRREYLERSINSVLNQSYKSFRLFIVDDGSDDGTKDFLFQKFSKQIGEEDKSSQINYIQASPEGVPSGVSRARNIGVYHGNGDLIAFLDSDDEWLENKLALQVEYFKKNPDIPLVHGEEIWVRKGVRVNPKKKHQKSGGDIFQRCLKLCLISPSAAVMKRDTLMELGGFDETFTVCEDYDLWLKLTAKYTVGFIQEPVIIKYGGHTGQLSQKYFAMDSWRVKSMRNLYEKADLGPEQKREVCLEIQNKAKILATGFAKHNKQEEAQKYQELENWAESEALRLFFLLN